MDIQCALHNIHLCCLAVPGAAWRSKPHCIVSEPCAETFPSIFSPVIWSLYVQEICLRLNANAGWTSTGFKMKLYTIQHTALWVRCILMGELRASASYRQEVHPTGWGMSSGGRWRRFRRTRKSRLATYLNWQITICLSNGNVIKSLLFQNVTLNKTSMSPLMISSVFNTI